MVSEAEIEAGFVHHAESLGCIALKLRIDGRKGFPDRTVFLPGGTPLFIEFKASGGVISPQQARWHKRLRSLGYHVYVAWSLDEAKTLLESHLP